MTHKDIYTKFQIEYDKESVTSSYPSLTQYEIATILDKAYLALIAQKFTGNNTRKAVFEADVKSVEDLRPLITTQLAETPHKAVTIPAENASVFLIPSKYDYVKPTLSSEQAPEFLYFVQAFANTAGGDHTVDLLSHANAKQFMKTENNIPWIKNDVCYIEGIYIVVLSDAYTNEDIYNLYVTYIHKPARFVDHYKNPEDQEFELSETMAEELINLAIVFALENVESQRLSTKVQTRGLEA